MYENDFCEFAVVKKKEGAYLAKIVLCAAFAVLVAAAAFLFVIPTSGAVGFVVIALDAALVWYLSRFTAIEYEYSLSGGYMDFAAIYSKEYRKEKLSVELKKSARKVMPYNGSLEGFNVTHIDDFRSSVKAEHSYVLVYEDEKGEKAVLFDATKKIVDAMFHQIPSLVVRSGDLK
ncbi:MAG: hypothetical protein IJ002_03450 [Clostridia bacterium]|nr:hypothetical protein [Clostridia bacterium]